MILLWRVQFLYPTDRNKVKSQFMSCTEQKRSPAPLYKPLMIVVCGLKARPSLKTQLSTNCHKGDKLSEKYFLCSFWPYLVNSSLEARIKNKSWISTINQVTQYSFSCFWCKMFYKFLLQLLEINIQCENTSKEKLNNYKTLKVFVKVLTKFCKIGCKNCHYIVSGEGDRILEWLIKSRICRGRETLF